MKSRLFWILLVTAGALLPSLRAEPSLLNRALETWAGGHGDLAFTQRSRALTDDGRTKEEHLERYDPSLPDSERWRLLEVDGQPATAAQRAAWEQRKNSKPRKKVLKKPAEYLAVDQARVLKETSASTSFAVPLRPETARLLALENIAVVITVDKETASIAGIGATLRQPIRVLLGLARITELDVDVKIEPTEADAGTAAGKVQDGSTARATMSKLGNEIEYEWSDFKRVTPFGQARTAATVGAAAVPAAAGRTASGEP